MAKKSKSSRSNGIVWNEVTWYSRLIALFLFLLVIPVIWFYIGTQYERTITVLSEAVQQ